MLPILLAGLIGCTNDNPYQTAGFTLGDYFPLDGERTWRYTQDDQSFDWQLSVAKVPQTTTVGSTEIVTLEYYEFANGSTGDLLYDIQWSADSSDGILVWGYSDEVTGESVSYDPPVTFGKRQMVPGDSYSTETDGRTFTTTFNVVESCPNDWRADWDCLSLTVDDGDGDDSAGPPFAGDWWIAASYGPSRFIPTGYTDPWVLATASFEGSTE